MGLGMKKQSYKISEIRQRYEEYHRCEGVTSLPLVNATLIRMAGEMSKKVCLDIGCGQGGLTTLITRRGQFTVGVDMSRNAVSWAKKRLESSHGRAAFMVADARYLPFRGKTFDIVFSAETLEHLPSIYEGLEEVRRVLKDEGIFLTSTPNYFNTYGLVRLISEPTVGKWLDLGWGLTQPIDHFITPFKMKKILGELNLEIVEMYSGELFYGLLPYEGLLHYLWNRGGWMVTGWIRRIINALSGGRELVYKRFPFNYLGFELFIKGKKIVS